MTSYFNESETKRIVIRDRDFNTTIMSYATEDEINALLAEIEFLNREVKLLKRQMKKRFRK